MGADLYLEERDWRPRPTRAVKNAKDRYVLYEDRFAVGWFRLPGSHPNNDMTRRLLAALHVDTRSGRPDTFRQ